MLKRRALSEREHLVNEHCGYGTRLLNAMLIVSVSIGDARETFAKCEHSLNASSLNVNLTVLQWDHHQHTRQPHVTIKPNAQNEHNLTCTILCFVLVLGKSKTKTKRFLFCYDILTCQNKKSCFLFCQNQHKIVLIRTRPYAFLTYRSHHSLMQTCCCASPMLFSNCL